MSENYDVRKHENILDQLGDDNHFRYFAPDPPASIPAGTVMEMEIKTAAERVAERKAWRDSTKLCECCGGLGRILRS